METDQLGPESWLACPPALPLKVHDLSLKFLICTFGVTPP